MSILATDKRSPSAPFSTGTPSPAAHDEADMVLVQAKTSYFEGSDMKHAHSEPYLLPRHIAREHETNRIAEILEPKKPVEPPAADEVEEEAETDEGGEVEVEQPDDTSRAPSQDQVTASTVPARPGAEPHRPAPGPVPPAATSEPPHPVKRGRGRPPVNRG